MPKRNLFGKLERYFCISAALDYFHLKKLPPSHKTLHHLCWKHNYRKVINENLSNFVIGNVSKGFIDDLT